MPRSPRIGRRVCRAALIGLMILSVPGGWALAGTSDTPAGDLSQNQKWLEGLTLVRTGQFDKAARHIEAMLADGVKDDRVQKVEGWLEAFTKLQEQRAGRANRDYEKYVKWVQEDIEGFEKDEKRGWWRLAIQDCARAWSTAEDRQAVVKERWFQEAVEGALKTAAAHEKEDEWFKAARIYGPVTEMFPLNKEYREALKRCQSHIRLELLYSEDSGWEATVKDIFPSMASDAFRKIEESYLTEPVFKDAAVAGIEQLLRLAHTPKLAKVFPALGEEDKATEFCDRLEVRLRQVRQTDKTDAEDLIDLFERVLAINREIKLIPSNVLIHEFVHGALQPLDQFSDMLWPADILEFNKHTQGRFSGVGIQIRKSPGEPIKVISPLDDTPAYHAGIQPGDLITEINGQPTEKITVTDAVRKITGPPGTSVTLTIRRTGESKELSVKLKREEIVIYTIKGFVRDDSGEWQYMIDPDQKIGYLRMTNFTEGTIDELKDIVQKLHDEEQMRGLVFDLRGNPGGPLKSAVEVTDLFLEGNKKIVSTKDREGQPWAKSSTNDEHFTDFPLIILVDETTASASEIVSGALQVHKRALILGERSYGKGSVQQVLPLNRSNLAFLKLTTAHYYLPNNRCLHREEDSTTWGVDPDIEVKLVPKEFVKMRELQLKRDILKGRNQERLSDEELSAVTGYGSTTRPAADDDEEQEDTGTAAHKVDEETKDSDEPEVTREDQNEFPAIDPQIEAALMLMRIRLETGMSWETPSEAIAATPTPVDK